MKDWQNSAGPAGGITRRSIQQKGQDMKRFLEILFDVVSLASIFAIVWIFWTMSYAMGVN